MSLALDILRGAGSGLGFLIGGNPLKQNDAALEVQFNSQFIIPVQQALRSEQLTCSDAQQLIAQGDMMVQQIFNAFQRQESRDAWFTRAHGGGLYRDVQRPKLLALCQKGLIGAAESLGVTASNLPLIALAVGGIVAAILLFRAFIR